MSVRVGVIGAGIMGADHARIIAGDIPGAVLQVICDADQGRARKVADETGALAVTTDPLAVISNPEVDAVLIASPDDTHASLTIACIEAHKPVLCEKPLAPTSGECLRVIAAEQTAGKRLVQVGFMRRFDQSYVEMKTAFEDGLIGEALMFHCFHRNVSAPAFFTGAMAITNSAPHEFDIARHMLQSDCTAISVFRTSVADSEQAVEPVFMVLHTLGGHLVNIEINNNARYGYDVRGELVGQKGSVFLRSPINSEIHLNLQHVERYPADWRPRFAVAYQRQNRAWVDSIGTGRQPAAAASAWDGYCAAVIAEAGLMSLASGTTAAIAYSPKPDLYD